MTYDELIKDLRFCVEEGSCRKCRFDNNMNCSDTLMAKAADAIEELQATVDGLTAQTNMVFEKTEGRTVIKFEPKWIPVTERLPEVGKKVLVFAYGNDTLTARMQKRTENGHPVFECNGIFLEMAKLGRITHWMPLPEPPKEET